MTKTDRSTPATTDDAARLAELGYESHFERRMGLWENFALGFTYLSPVVGIYSVFALGFVAGGPPMIWSIVIAGIGQLLVALVFAEVVAQFPVAGGIYPWARRLIGRRWAWITGWIYGWALIATIASVSTGAVLFVGSLFGFTPTRFTTVLIAGGLMVLCLLINLSGTRTLGRVAMAGFAAELVGALFVGLWLLIFERNQDFSVLFDGLGTQGDGSYLGAFLAASLLGLYLFYGFEACGDVAEEVPDPGKTIPKAMRRTIYVGGAAALLITAALILAQPDFNAILSGENADPVGNVFKDVFGTVGSKVITVIVLISFVSCILSLQAAASRLIYSYARDRMIFASGALSRFSRERHVPPIALTVACLVPAGVVAIAEIISDSALLRVISFASAGIYIAFQLVVLAALIARSRGWQPSGKFTLGRYGFVVNICALVYGVGGALNLAWPRGDAAWYDKWIVVLGCAIVAGVGLAYMLLGRPYERSEAPHGDAIGMRATT
ncbi:amino acid/polyamine/organocation transporter (APC superfamily) [Solirubrobacter pauli]|uniref:Amino acid/polyamine/organocation transporter (APC superfamily) n=1 Tax=Solirubrobacter pauli TaxID=166793 RepID=A0A660L1K1_9ACTN|nr:amino acid permease [Solirubrobacter pauli]RKQ87195.1 amino acid/polyamine/organocation transporter (APC superfamily) [Solirubrobacter pauli]